MASKLDRSLDAIIGDRPARRGRGGRARPARSAPVGGVRKAVAAAKGAAAKVATKVANKATGKSDTSEAAGTATKVIVSNLVRPPPPLFRAVLMDH